LKATTGSEFLFGSEITDYLLDLRKRLYRVRELLAKLKVGPDQASRDELLELRENFKKELEDKMRNRFDKYLNFSTLT
jgi:hypothetical protein